MTEPPWLRFDRDNAFVRERNQRSFNRIMLILLLLTIGGMIETGLKP